MYRAHNLTPPLRAKSLAISGTYPVVVSDIGTAPIEDCHPAEPISLATFRMRRTERALALSYVLGAAGWTGGRLARVMGVSPSLVGRYLSGEAGFSDAQIDKMGSVGVALRARLDAM